MIEQLPTVLSALVNDGFTLEKLQGGSIVGISIAEILARVLRDRVKVARELLIGELRRGEKNLTAPEIEEAVAVVYRYFRSAQEGTARLNLHLMAKVIAGQAYLGKLTASEFLADADILSSLRYKEIVLLGTMYNIWISEWFQSTPLNQRAGKLQKCTATKLVPVVFESEDELQATAGAITRTGLLKYEPTWDQASFTPTSLLDRLNSLAPLEATLNECNTG